MSTVVPRITLRLYEINYINVGLIPTLYDKKMISYNNDFSLLYDTMVYTLIHCYMINPNDLDDIDYCCNIQRLKTNSI